MEAAMTDADILFREYDTLRAEMINHQANWYNLLIAFGALAAWVLSQNYRTKMLWLALAAGVFVIGCIVLAKFARRLSIRIAEIEKEINDISGKTLLRWETSRGWGTKGVRKSLSAR
jgi:hypothetical protein